MSGLDKFNYINKQKLNQITYLLHQNSSFRRIGIYTSQKKKRYTSFYFYNIFNTNNILW